MTSCLSYLLLLHRTWRAAKIYLPSGGCSQRCGRYRQAKTIRDADKISKDIFAIFWPSKDIFWPSSLSWPYLRYLRLVDSKQTNLKSMRAVLRLVPWRTAFYIRLCKCRNVSTWAVFRFKTSIWNITMPCSHCTVYYCGCSKRKTAHWKRVWSGRPLTEEFVVFCESS